jgi:hypothetical protein
VAVPFETRQFTACHVSVTLGLWKLHKWDGLKIKVFASILKVKGLNFISDVFCD